MMTVFSTPPSLCCGSAVLAGGRSPVRWQHTNRQASERMRELERSTAWISSFEESRPWLRRGPLLGDAIDLVTRDLSGAPANSGSRQAVRRKRKATSEALPSMDRVRTAVSSESKPRHSTDFLGLPQEAGREFLASLAEGRRPAKPMQERVERHPPGTKHAWLPRNFPPQTPSEARSAFAERLSDRLAKSLGDHTFSHSRFAGVLGDAWATALNGPEANPELLNTSIASSSADKFGGSHNTAPVARGDSVRLSSPERSNLPGAAPGQYGPSAAPLPPLSSRAAPDQFPSASPFGASLFESLKGSQAEGWPAAIARRRTAEEASFDWDVEALSVGIKRILDNEARRHGIDV